MTIAYKPLSCVLIKPAGPDCNLRCTYCFYQEKSALFAQNHKPCRMSYETLKAVTQNALKNARGNFSFIWQGGEPTLMGLDFYKKAVALQKKYAKNCVVTNVMQTNGTLLTNEWCIFLKENNFLVGISLDGEEHVHNKYRCTASNIGTHTAVSGAAQRLLVNQVECNALSCLTEYSAQYITESYEYLKHQGFTYMQFIPVIEKRDDGTATDFSVTAKSYGEALCRLFDAWLADFVDGNPTTSIRLFETTFFTLLGQGSPECGSRKTCGTYLAVEHNGDIYPCDFFVEKSHLLGNAHEHDMTTVLNSQKQSLFGNAKARLGNDCAQCPWLELCGGGCLKDRRNNPAGFEKTYFCESLKAFYAHAVPTLKEMTKHWQQ